MGGVTLVVEDPDGRRGDDRFADGVVVHQPRWPRWALAPLAAMVVALAVLVTGIDRRGASPTPPSTTVAASGGSGAPGVIRPGAVLAAEIVLPTPVDLQVHVAANGTDGAPSGLYLVDLASGSIRLLEPRAWASGDQLFSFGYGAVIFDARQGQLTMVTRAGIKFALPGGRFEQVAADVDGIHLWTAVTRADGVYLQRHRVDGGGVDREFVLPHQARLLNVGIDGWPLVAGPTGGTFALDPASGERRRASDGQIVGVAGSGVVELVCDDQLACVLQWLQGTGEEGLVISADPFGVPSVSPDGGTALVVTREGVDTANLRTGATSGVSLSASASEATGAPVLTPSSQVWSADSTSAVFAFGGRLYLLRSGENENSVELTSLNERLGAVLAVTAGTN